MIYKEVGIQPRNLMKGDIGIEIEVEGRRLAVDSKWWNREYDGSLNNGIEYVLDKPQSLGMCKVALADLKRLHKKSNSEFKESVRAGVHVHVNVQRLSVEKLWNFVTIYLILEDLLIKFCGHNRESNLFCLRASDAEYVLYLMDKAIQHDNLAYLNDEDIRYAALNLTAIGKYGSLEFRAMRSTKDFDVIYDWVSILHRLRAIATTFNNPMDVVNCYKSLGAKAFAEKMLGDKYKLFSCHNVDKLLDTGFVNAMWVAYAKDWGVSRKKEVKKERVNPNTVEWVNPPIPRPAPVGDAVVGINEIFEEHGEE